MLNKPQDGANVQFVENPDCRSIFILVIIYDNDIINSSV